MGQETTPSLDSVRLMIPGPGELTRSDLAVLGEPTVPHYGIWWADAYRTLLKNLETLLDADSVYVVPGSGSAGLEIALINLFAPGERVVVPDTGFFGSRFAEIARAVGLNVDLVPVPLDRPIDPDTLRDHLTTANGLLVVHVDSTTGIRHPLSELAALARATDTRLVVDAVASLGGEDVRLRAMDLDAVVAAPQKGLAAPAGLAIVALSGEGVEAARNHRPRSWYFDLGRWAESLSEDAWEPHPITMPTASLRALMASLSRVLARDPQRWIAERAGLAATLRSRLAYAGFTLHAADEHAANLVTVVRNDDPTTYTRRTAARGIMIGSGLPPIEDAFRIGLLGDTASEVFIGRLLDVLAP